MMRRRKNLVAQKYRTMMSMKPTPYIAAKATARDAIVTFGAGYGFLYEPVEWRVTEYLQNEYLYVIGGRDAHDRLSTVECYDASINAWSPWNVASLTTARWGHGVITLGGFIYAIGGRDGTHTVLSSAERYDPSTNVWTAVASMATGRSYFGAVTF